MTRFFAKLVHFLLAFIFCSQCALASTGNFKELVQEYNYTLTVEWDQKDLEFLKSAESKFSIGVRELLKEGSSPLELMAESLDLISDLKLRRELSERLKVYHHNKMSNEELLEFVERYSSSMQTQGTSWSPAMKILLGVVGGYIAFKLILVTIMYWDTDPNYGEDGNPPPKPE